MKEAEATIQIPCIRALEFNCNSICDLLPYSATGFWESVYYHQVTPEEERQILLEDALNKEHRELREKADELLRSTGMIYLCKSYLEGC